MFKVFLVSVGLKGKLLCSGFVYLAVIPDSPKETDHETFYFVSFWRGGVRVLQEAAEDSLPVPTSHLSVCASLLGKPDKRTGPPETQTQVSTTGHGLEHSLLPASTPSVCLDPQTLVVFVRELGSM